MRNKINQITIFLLLIFGFFFPSSVNGVISLNLELAHSGILILLLSILLFNNKIPKITFWLSFSILFILFFFTMIQLFLTNPALEKISVGSFLPIIAMVILFSTSYIEVKSTSMFDFMFVFINITLIAAGLLTVYDNQGISTFIYNNYSMGYEELSTNMLTFNKPVNMFGSHSIASIFYYLFFYINLKKFEYTKHKLNIILAVLNLVLIINLKSVSAFGLLFIAILQILFFLFQRHRNLFLVTAPFIMFFVFYIYSLVENDLVYSLGLEDNGFLGRYSSNSVLSVNFDYIKSHVLPIGLWISDNLYFTDSGFVVNYLKGSIFLVLAIYLCLFYFVKHNIEHKKTAQMIFLIILIFELGYPILSYNRMLYFLPFVMIYMRELNPSKIKLDLLTINKDEH